MSATATELDQAEIADVYWLREIFELDKNDLTHEVLYSAVLAIAELLEHGEQVGFVPKSDYLGGTQIRDEWGRWLDRFPSTLSKYKGKPSNTSDIAYNPRKSVGNIVVDVLIYKDPAAPFSAGKSSKLHGLKLILFALTLIPNLKDRGIDLEKVASDFRAGIKKSEIFRELSLNFAENTSLSILIDECELLIKEKYSSGGFRHFLSSIRDAVLVIQGWRIGPKNRKKTSSKGSMRGQNAFEGKNKPLSVRLRSYHSTDDPDEQAYVGEMISLQGEDGGEEPVLGVIEAPEASDDDALLSNKLSAAITQTKSKYWLQLYHESIPWSSRGINPLTRAKLVDWIKANDTVESLILALMLLTGSRYEAVVDLLIGNDGDITLDGIYTRHYIPPEKAYNPPDDLSPLLEKSIDILRLNFPALVTEMLSNHCINYENGVSLRDALSLDVEETKKNIQKTIKKLIKNGANGLAIDRIPLALNKKISEITGDDAAGYILSARDNEMAPVSTYYSAFEVSDLEAIYRKAVRELFYESTVDR